MKNNLLKTLLLFNAFTAIVGGAALIAEVLEPPMSLLEGTSFKSFLLPGLILGFLVGGSALFGFIEQLKRFQDAAIISTISGFVLVGWILGEVAILQEMHWLQLLYFVSGISIIGLSYTDLKQTVLKKGAT